MLRQVSVRNRAVPVPIRPFYMLSLAIAAAKSWTVQCIRLQLRPNPQLLCLPIICSLDKTNGSTASPAPILLVSTAVLCKSSWRNTAKQSTDRSLLTKCGRSMAMVAKGTACAWPYTPHAVSDRCSIVAFQHATHVQSQVAVTEQVSAAPGNYYWAPSRSYSGQC